MSEPRPARQARLGIWSRDVHQGAAFYADLERWAARIWPEEWQRPAITVELGAIGHVDRRMPWLEIGGGGPPLAPEALRELLLAQGHGPITLPSGAISAIPARLSAPPPSEGAPRLGIFGGLGPLAGAQVLQTLVQRSAPGLSVSLLSNPGWPLHWMSMSQAFLRLDTWSAASYLWRARQFLKSPDFRSVGLACNSAHQYFSQIQYLARGRLLHLPTETARATAARFPGGRVYLLSTSLSRELSLYSEPLLAAGLTLLPMADALTVTVQQGIRLVKRGDVEGARARLQAAVDGLTADADAVIFGCTELALAPPAVPWPVIDSGEVLAEALLASLSPS